MEQKKALAHGREISKPGRTTRWLTGREEKCEVSDTWLFSVSRRVCTSDERDDHAGHFQI